jgi:hypothetical protein
MENFVFPDYDNSILNLMSSVKKGLGGKKTRYNELKSLPAKELEKYDDVILIVIDGLGYNYLLNKEDSFMKMNLISGISSTFLSTTACANTVFYTGQSPNETGITGWFTYLRQMGVISAILPYFSPIGRVPLKDFANLDKFVNIKSIFSGIKAKSFAIIEEGLKGSEFNKIAYNGAKMIYRKSIKDAFKKLSKLIDKKSKGKRFMHVYLSEFDHDSHIYGPKSSEAKKTFLLIDSLMKKIEKRIRGKNALLLATADHGFSSTNKKDVVVFDDFPKMKECTIMPFSSDTRAVSCFVKPGMEKQFLSEAKKHSEYFHAIKGSDVLKKKLYGMGIDHPEMKYRVGDFMLLLKKNYAMYYSKSSAKKAMKGNHSGLSKDEMIVPLVAIYGKK